MKRLKSMAGKRISPCLKEFEDSFFIVGLLCSRTRSRYTAPRAESLDLSPESIVLFVNAIRNLIREEVTLEMEAFYGGRSHYA
jgi:hypothetical protein